MRVFIVDWQQGAKSGTSVVKASSPTALRRRLWMFQYARITEVESIAAWEWRGHRRKLDKVQASNRYIIGELSISRSKSNEHGQHHEGDSTDQSPPTETIHNG